MPSAPPILDNIFNASPMVVEAANWLVNTYPIAFNFVKSFFGVLVGISFPLSLFFVVGIIYCVERIKVVRDKESLIHEAKVEPAYDAVDKPDQALANRWTSVQTHIESPNENDWRQAILEADIILDDILTKMGYRGESIGEKLKRVEPGDMKSLDAAWEAHKVRNEIAHSGSLYAINQHTAKQVVNQYKKVFEEFYYI